MTGTLTSTGGDVDEVIGTEIVITDDDTATGIALSVDIDPEARGDQAEIGEDAGETEVTLTATVLGGGTFRVNVVLLPRVVGGSATPSADATSGDYQLENIDGTSVSNVTLPISLGRVEIPMGEGSASWTFKVTPNNPEPTDSNPDVEGNETIEIYILETVATTVWGTTLVIVDNEIGEGAGYQDLPGPVTLNTPVLSTVSTNNTISATLTWHAPRNPPTNPDDRTKGRPGGYRVERRSSTSPQWVLAGTLTANPSHYTFTDENLPAGVEYEWRVTAYITAVPQVDGSGEPVRDSNGDIIRIPCGGADGCAATPSEPKAPRTPTPPRPPSGGGGPSPAPDPEDEVVVELPVPSRPVAVASVVLPSDVAAGSVHADGVLAMLRLGVMELGSVAGFVPRRSMSRGDVAAPLVRLWQVLGRDCPTDAATPFEDIDDLQLAADAGCLRGLGVTAGTTATTFSPGLPVTRAQTATLLARVWELLGRDCPDGGALPFDDVACGQRAP